MPTRIEPLTKAEIPLFHQTRPFFLFTQNIGDKIIAKAAGWSDLIISGGDVINHLELNGIGELPPPNAQGVITADTATEVRLFRKRAHGEAWLFQVNNPHLFVEPEPSPEPPPRPGFLDRILRRRP